MLSITHLLLFGEPELRREYEESWKELGRARDGFCVLVRHAGNEGDECMCEICEETRTMGKGIRRAVVDE